MVSGTAIWGSVAPKLQVFDFPFLWRDWAHVHRHRRRPVGREAADYLERPVRMRPLAWGDSFGFRQVVTRSRDVTEPGQLAGLKIRTIQSPIYVKAVELMGASPTPMAFGEVYTSLQTGVIDGYEHDASTTLQQRFYEVARLHGAHAAHRRRARALGVDGDAGAAAGRTCAPLSKRRRSKPPRGSARWDRARTPPRRRTLAQRRHDHPRDRRQRVAAGRRKRLWQREARALGVSSWLEAILA